MAGVPVRCRVSVRDARVSVRDVRRNPEAGRSRGSARRQVAAMRRSHGVDGTGIGIGVISSGAASLATGDAPEDLLDRVTVLPGQAGEGDAGMAALGVLRDLAPGAELYFATGVGGPARFAANVEALCHAGADIIIDDVFDFQKTIHQGGLMARGIARAVRDGCVYVSAAGDRPGADSRSAAEDVRDRRRLRIFRPFAAVRPHRSKRRRWRL